MQNDTMEKLSLIVRSLLSFAALMVLFWLKTHENIDCTDWNFLVYSILWWCILGMNGKEFVEVLWFTKYRWPWPHGSNGS